MKPCSNCNDLRYIQDAGFACCETCNPNNSFYDMKQSDTPETDEAYRFRDEENIFSHDLRRLETMQRFERERNQRDEALLQIASILREKEIQHKDLMLGSTAFKSVLSWAEKFKTK